jgi:hypothetical protein
MMGREGETAKGRMGAKSSAAAKRRKNIAQGFFSDTINPGLKPKGR